MTSDTRSGDNGGALRSWIPDIVGGRYRVERELGSGAAAVTVLATDQTLERRVAVKLLKPESDLDPEFSRRFSREARAAASVSHQHVVNVYDVGQDGDLLYLVMQFVEGTDLKRVIDREGALPWARAVKIARDVLSGLTAIHATGIVHRDIKPQNVLIGSDGSVKVTDFGVAHVDLDSGLTTAGMTVGTATYMAPEQAQGNPVTPAADVYAVGVMLYEMVSGGVPFAAPTSMAVMLAHIQEQAKAPEAPARMERVPDGLLAVIRQAMSKDPLARFKSADAMRSALASPEAWQNSGFTVGSPQRTGQTQVVPSRPPAGAAAPSRARRPSYATPATRRVDTASGAGRGFGAFLLVMLLVLALGLVATAGTLWYLEQQDNGGPSSRSGSNAPQENPESPGLPRIEDDPTQEVDDIDEAPGIIGPIATEALPAEAPAPTDEVIAPPTLAPSSTSPPIEPMVSPTSASSPLATIIEPSTEQDGGDIIERIEDPTVPSDG